MSSSRRRFFLAADGAAPPGTLTPPEGQSFPVTDSGTVASCPMPLGFRECTGGGGITFYGISFTGASQAIYVSMDDDRTSPWGGICNACVDLGATTFSTSSSGGTKNACSDGFTKAVTFTPTWTQFKIAFSDMTFTPENWSLNGVSAPIHSNKVYNPDSRARSPTVAA